uniref:Transcription factor TCP18 n=1 Tax=Cajanus cajan TaxID=3821 RepID=A0A151R0V7_CAJCA|nr:Transcription factor TCP18 [Cajanus cajan]
MQSQTSSDTFFLSHNGNDQISYYDPAFFYTRPFTIDSQSKPTSKQENNYHDLPSPPPLSFFHFPSPPFEETQFFLQQHHDFLLQSHHQAQPQATEPEPFMEASVRSSDQIPRKRTGKRDRHSKINTARGLRDRRMRLSLEVAKRFFGLQDMLGFDKASKTVEWLLNQAKDEINRVAREKKKDKKKNHDDDHNCGAKSGASSSSSECEEGVSSVDEVVVSGGREQQEERVDKVVKRKVKHCRAFHPLAKECRERARERARERTREKMRTRGVLLSDESTKCGEETNQDLTQLGSWNPFESGTKTHSVHSSLDVIITEAKEHPKEHLETHVQAMAHDDDDDDSLVILNKWSPSLIFNGSGFSHEVSLN